MLARSENLGDINIQVVIDPDGKDGPTGFLTADSVKATVFDVSSVHPTAGDFKDGEACKVMLSTKQDDKYYTEAITAKPDEEGESGKPAQTSDGEVTISAYIKPKPPEDYSGVTTYFEVTDPDDRSHYEGKSGPGDPSVQGDTDPNDNLHKFLGLNRSRSDYGIFELYRAFNGWGLSDRSATTDLVEIDGKERAVAETTLNMTQRHSGDNYRIRATLRNPEPDMSGQYDYQPFDTLSGTTEDEDVPAANSRIEASTTLIAWKRVYIETGFMCRQGCTITEENLQQDDDRLELELLGTCFLLCFLLRAHHRQHLR